MTELLGLVIWLEREHGQRATAAMAEHGGGSVQKEAGRMTTWVQWMRWLQLRSRQRASRQLRGGHAGRQHDHDIDGGSELAGGHWPEQCSISLSLKFKFKLLQNFEHNSNFC